MSTNPLLTTTGTPPFKSILPEHVEPAVRQRLEEYEAKVEELMTRGGPYTWDNFMAPLEQLDELISRAWGPAMHLNGVMDSDELREACKVTRPLITDFSAKMGQDERQFAATQEVSDNADALGLDPVQRRVLELQLRNFRLAGVALPPEKKERYRKIAVELSKIGTTFSDNILDDTKDYRLVVKDPALVECLPESLREMARSKALEDDSAAPEQRWSFTLQMPCVIPFMQYQEDRGLREELYKGFTTRASEGERDNAPLINQILALRAEKAALLGFESFAELSLAKKMAGSAPEVLEFLTDLADKARAFGQRDHDALQEFAKQDGLDDLRDYDKAHYTERLRQQRYSFSDEEVRQYFPVDRVLAGLFQTLNRLYGLEMQDVTESTDHERWHEDVRVIEVRDEDGPRGVIYMDLFARDGKRGGAWMGGCLDRRLLEDGSVQLPVAYLCCNFAAPAGGKPSLLRHREVQTVFHECGHALHHVLTRVDHAQVGGISQVPWDGVELPSQFHENWTWQAESLAFLAGHHETGEPLPKELLDKMLGAKNYMSGANMQRQLVFALFDMRLHSGFEPGGERTVRDVLRGVREDVCVPPPPEYNLFENSFRHIFSGGYAAGYFSYKWAEVLAADAFSRFEEEGLFSPEAGRAFRETILEQGGSRELMDLYVEFRGRKPTPEALLRHSGLVAT